MSDAGITQKQLHSELAQQFQEFSTLLEADFERLAEKVRQGLKEELEGWKARNSKLEMSAQVLPAKFSATSHVQTQRRRSQEIGGRPQTGGMCVMSRSTSSLGTASALLQKSADLDEGIGDMQEIDSGKRVSEAEAGQLADQMAAELAASVSQSSMGFLHRHRRGYMAGRELDEVRHSVISSDTQGHQTDVATVATINEEGKPSHGELASVKRESWLRTVVNGPYFHMAATAFILLNAILMGIQTEHMARNLSEKEPTVFKVLERLFCVIFIVELALRVWASGMKTFCLEEDWQWNVFDAVVVGLQGIDVVLEFIVDTDANAKPGSDDLRGNMSILRVLRILRFVRIIRVLRTLRSVSELRTITVSIMGTFRILVWTLVLLFLVIFMIAVTVTQIVTYHLMHETDAKMQHALQMHYGSVGNSVLVLFQAITNGIDWEDMLNPLMEYISPLLALPVCIYIGFGTFALMNVVTGVFVESALESARREKERFLLNTVKNLFNTTDEDKSGDISWNEFQNKLHTSAMNLYFKAIDLDISEAQDLFRLIDVDDSGSIDPEEFVNGCIRLQGPAKSIDLATLMHEFKRSHKTIKQSHRALTTAVARLRNPTAGRHAESPEEEVVTM